MTPSPSSAAVASTLSSTLACLGCGGVDQTFPEASSRQEDGAEAAPMHHSSGRPPRESMRSVLRASISRRHDHGSAAVAPVRRSRSQERWVQEDSGEDDGGAAPQLSAAVDGAKRGVARQATDSTVGSRSTCTAASSAAASRGFHRHCRAMSDPFDAPFDTDGDGAEEYGGVSGAALALREEKKTPDGHGTMAHPQPLPTLPRFPVAATRNRNCWSEPPVALYQVRGRDYLRNGRRKVASGPYLATARGCDLLLLHPQAGEDWDSVNHGPRQGSMIHDRLGSILEGRLRLEPTVAINFQFPWGVMVLYFQVPRKLAPFMTDKPISLDTESLTVPERTLAKWLMGSPAYRNERLKLIPLVAEGPWVVRKMVTGTPAIIGKKLPVSHALYPAGVTVSGAGSHAHALQPLLLTTLDIGSGSATAKRIVGVCRRYMSALTVDIGFVIQGDTAEELPEQMLGSIRIHGPDPLKACHITQ